MQPEIIDFRRRSIENILSKQDQSFRWGFDEIQAYERPDHIYYSPNYTSTLWTLLLLADIKASADIPQIKSALQLITERFYAPEYEIFRLPGMSHFPIPCLNGNMIYLHHYFKTAQSGILDETIDFFTKYQRFDDGDFKTPREYPYRANISCYGKHTCYWGVTKLLKGISFIPTIQRSQQAQQLIEHCIDFVLQHEVCFKSSNLDKFLDRGIDKLTFPNFYKSDFLEILWLLARENVQDRRISRALNLLRSKRKYSDSWGLEKSFNTIVPIGRINCANMFITERATEVLDHYGS